MRRLSLLYIVGLSLAGSIFTHSMRVGLTGGIGCGKSTVVRFFAEAGWRTIESDEVVRELLRSDPHVHTALRGHWGVAVFDAAGQVDRKAIAERVFADEAELRWLEGLLHPLVRDAWKSKVAADPEADWLVEIPLLFEKRLETEFDLTVCVSCTAAVIDRRMVNRGYSGDEVEQRRQRQMPLEEKVVRAHHVISNNGSLDFLKLQTTHLIEQIRHA